MRTAFLVTDKAKWLEDVKVIVPLNSIAADTFQKDGRVLQCHPAV